MPLPTAAIRSSDDGPYPACMRDTWAIRCSGMWPGEPATSSAARTDRLSARLPVRMALAHVTISGQYGEVETASFVVNKKA
jgi:hypothetical protein